MTRVKLDNQLRSGFLVNIWRTLVTQISPVSCCMVPWRLFEISCVNIPARSWSVLDHPPELPSHMLVVVSLAGYHFLPRWPVSGTDMKIVQLMTSQHGRQKTSRMNFAFIFSVSFDVSCSILLGSFPSREESITVLPATLQSLKVWISVVSQQVLF